jgi:4-aminobutyrate aminotransferase-like enzyme
MSLPLEFLPPLTIQTDEIDFALKVIAECIAEEE